MICDLQSEIWPFLKKTSASDATDLALIRMLQPPAELAVKRYVGYNIEQATHTEYLPIAATRVEIDPFLEVGGGIEVFGNSVVTGPPALYGHWDRLPLSNVPVRSITGVWQNPGAFQGGNPAGDWPDSTKLTEGTDYFQDLEASGLNWTGHLLRSGALAWIRFPRTYKATYTAGLTQAEMGLGNISTTTTQTISGTGSQSFTVASATGLAVGGSIILDAGNSGEETVTITALSSTTVTATVTATHANGITVTSPVGEYSVFKMAVIQTMQKYYVEIKSHQEDSTSGTSGIGATIGERLGDYSATFDVQSAKELTGFSRDLPRSAMVILEPYRRISAIV